MDALRVDPSRQGTTGYIKMHMPIMKIISSTAGVTCCKWISTLPFITLVLCADCRLDTYSRALHTPEFKSEERVPMPPPVTVKKGKAKRVNHSPELTYTHSKAHVVLNTVGEKNTFFGNKNSCSSCVACMCYNCTAQCKSGLSS